MLTNYWPIHQWSIDELSVKYRWTKSYIGRDTSGTTIDRVSTECRPTIVRVSTDYRPTIDRYINRVSTDYRPLYQPIDRSTVPTVNMIRSCLHVQIKRVRLPATLFSVSLSYRFFLCVCVCVCVCVFFFLFGLWLLTLFFHLACFPSWSCTWINVCFKLKSGVLFWKRDFKSSWSTYWPSLRPEKNHKLSIHIPPLKQLIFFQC